MMAKEGCESLTLMVFFLYGCVFGQFGGQNIALHKETRQISDFGNYESYFAVDGNIGQSISPRNCAHTDLNHTKFWWTVDLGLTYYIDSVVIYGRTDCCKDRLSDFDLLFYNPSNASWDNYDIERGKLCCRQYGVSPSVLNVTCGTGIKGRYLKVLKKKNYDIYKDCLTLCEVQVFGKTSEEKRSGDLNVSTALVVHDDSKERRCDGSYAENLISTARPEPMCPCACSYKQQLDYWAQTDTPKHTREEWRKILIPVLEKLDKELRINKTKLSASRRKKESANDNRKSAQRLGIIGAVFLSTVIALLVFIDIASICSRHETTRRIRPRIP